MPGPYSLINERNRRPANGPQESVRCSFVDVLASSWNSDWELVCLDSGGSISQSSGSGVLVSSTTANAETILRYRTQVAGPLSLRAKVTLSQRIANNNFFVELVDIIGDGLAFTVGSTTAVTVTVPTPGPVFSAANVGQSMYLGAITGTAIIPGRYPIASVDATGKQLTFTVTAGPGSGSGTCSLFGWNTFRCLYDSTTATNMKFDVQRNGWNSGDTTATINTSASGHVLAMYAEEPQVVLSDTTTNSLTFSQRAQRTENIPNKDVRLSLQIRSTNGTTNPASGTTMTVGFVGIEAFEPQIVAISSQKASGAANSVTIQGGSLTANQSSNVAQINGVTPLMGNGVTGTGSPRVTLASDGTAISTAGYISVKVDQTTPGTTNAVTVTPSASVGASSTSHLISANTTNATSVKASAGTINTIVASNLNAATRFLKIYNKASAPTVGTDTPVLTIMLPPTSNVVVPFGLGFRCSTGIAFALTTGITVADTGVVIANEHSVSIAYT